MYCNTILQGWYCIGIATFSEISNTDTRKTKQISYKKLGIETFEWKKYKQNNKI